MYACAYVPGATETQRAALLRCAECVSPIFEPGREYVILDIRGLASLIGTPRDIAMRIAAGMQTSELTGNVGVATNPHAALAAARGMQGVNIIAPGDEARALAHLPIALLDPSDDLADTLAAWGIRTFGDLSRLPAIGLAERLGEEGARLHSLARGMSPAPIVPLVERPTFEASIEIDHPLDSLEPLAFLAGRLLNEVCAKLTQHGLAAAAVTFRLALENGAEHRRSIRIPFPSADAATFLKLMQYDLAAHPPEAPIIGIMLEAEATSPRRLQGGLFRPVAPEPEKLELTLARLTAVAGEGNVGSPVLLNTHRPDAFRLDRFVAVSDMPAQKPAGLSVPLAIRLYRPPLPAEVAVAAGAPQHIRARGIRGDVLRYAGPWRTSGDWWRDDAWSRDEWDIALNTGVLYRVFRDAPGRWYVGGNYD